MPVTTTTTTWTTTAGGRFPTQATVWTGQADAGDFGVVGAKSSAWTLPQASVPPAPKIAAAAAVAKMQATPVTWLGPEGLQLLLKSCEVSGHLMDSLPQDSKHSSQALDSSGTPRIHANWSQHWPQAGFPKAKTSPKRRVRSRPQPKEKNEYWASCRQSCQPGEVNPNDDPDSQACRDSHARQDFRTPWSCTKLGTRAEGCLFQGVQRMCSHDS